MAGIHLLILATAAVSLVTAYHGADLPPGPYCGLGGRRGGCCINRRDACSHRILNTLCYCDEFCNMNRTQGNDDCCPDYEEVCLGLVSEYFTDAVCILGRTKTDRCNKCSCEEVNGKPDWVCEQDDCMISDDVIYRVNQGGETWHAANYSKYVDKKLKDGIKYRLGTRPLDPDTRRMGSIQYNKPINKGYFNAVLQWPSYISPIADQGWCGSDWAVVIASIASDRLAIQSRGAESKLLSAQSLLSCDKRGQRGCDGGHIDRAWNFARVFGLVDEDCFPYKASVTRCPYKVHENLLMAGCKPQNNKRTSKYKASPPYRLKKEEDIMYDLMESGPVLAVMTVYQDFFHYRSGVYRHTRHGNQVEQGLHSVKIVGWGGDGRDRYWIVANSWSKDWGQDGYFHIARGSNESGIESFVISGLMDVVEANQRK